MENMRAQAERFGAELVTEDITEMDLTGPIKVVTDGYGNSFAARTVILAMGSAYRKLGVPDEDRLSGHGVSWCATCDGFFFRDKDIAVVGGGDSAMEEATFLSRFARSVTIVHRRGELRASKIMAARAENDPKINFAWHSEVAALHGDQTLDRDHAARHPYRRGAGAGRDQGLFIAVGHDPRSELVHGQVETDAAGYVITDGKSTRTNLPGVFASGDLVDHVYRQAVTAAGTGCAAALGRRALSGRPERRRGARRGAGRRPSRV